MRSTLKKVYWRDESKNGGTVINAECLALVLGLAVVTTTSKTTSYVVIKCILVCHFFSYLLQVVCRDSVGQYLHLIYVVIFFPGYGT